MTSKSGVMLAVLTGMISADYPYRQQPGRASKNTKADPKKKRLRKIAQASQRRNRR